MCQGDVKGEFFTHQLRYVQHVNRHWTSFKPSQIRSYVMGYECFGNVHGWKDIIVHKHLIWPSLNTLVPRHMGLQVEEMCVKTGLDTSEELTKQLMDAIAARVDPYGFIDFEAFLKALAHFKDRLDAGAGAWEAAVLKDYAQCIWWSCWLGHDVRQQYDVTDIPLQWFTYKCCYLSSVASL